MNRYIKDHIRLQQLKIGERSRTSMIIIFPVLFILFFVLAPGWWGHQRYQLALGLGFPTSWILGTLFLFPGVILYLWTIVLFAQAQGTQVPMAPTQKLVTKGPYAASRNPMVTATSMMVLGVGLGLDSGSFILAGHLIPTGYLAYIKLLEEKELEARFGQAYRDYKKGTPFIVPRLWGRN